MEATNRIIVNTAVQYARTFIHMLVMLFSTRFVLAAMGESGYGTYSLIGSTVFLIGFITLSLANSTQRFLSYSHGKKDTAVLRSIFSNAFLLHLTIALVLVLAMAFLEPCILGKLSIPPEEKDAAVFCYFTVLLMVLLGFVTSPLRALFIARENIVYVSAVEVTDSLLKLLAALSLPYFEVNPLKLYSATILVISGINFLAYSLYAGICYEECHIPRYKEVSKSQMGQLTGYALWNVYAVGSTVFRTQGMAVLINRFLGTLANAAYGISLQVSNAVSFLAASILNAMNPQLMKAEGEGNRERMLLLSTRESKYSVLILSLLLIPLIVEMPYVLDFWLGNVPRYATMFCRMILIDLIADQFTIGLSSANQAIGKIRNYSLLTSTIRLMILPLAWLCLRLGYAPVYAMWAYIAVDVIIGIVRIPFLHTTAGLKIKSYCSEVVLRSMPTIAGIFLVSLLCTLLPTFFLRFILTELVSVLLGLFLIYALSLSRNEQEWLLNKIKRK